jgi:hypothetical protein
MEQEQHMVAYTSKINPEFNVFVVYKEYEGYKTIKDSLEKMNNSIGALWVGTKNIFIDGEAITDDNIDQDHLLAIEAHEIAHSMLNHEAGIDEHSEKEADLLGIALLEMSDLQRAASFLKDRMKELYGIDYTAFEEEFDEINYKSN